MRERRGSDGSSFASAFNHMQLSVRSALAALLPLFYLPACSGKPAELERSASFRSTLSPRQVTGTVRLYTPVLVHVVTDRDRLVTTPEHPFATLHGGWVRAGQLEPGDFLLSARVGADRVLAVHREEEHSHFKRHFSSPARSAARRLKTCLSIAPVARPAALERRVTELVLD
jgi:hypothetical protein